VAYGIYQDGEGEIATMGKSRVVPLVLWTVDQTGKHWEAWHKEYGKPTDRNLEKHVFAYADSLKLGGVNEHVSKALGYIPFPAKAYIVRQATGETLATWHAAMFQVF
jgi:hypothetical protein